MNRRVQLKRTRGWTMPPNTLKVDRTTRWGNPFRPADFADGAAGAVAAHGRWLQGDAAAADGTAPPSIDEIRAALGGHDLACWCSLDGPCHADLLLRLAAGPSSADVTPAATATAASASPARRRRGR